MQIAPPGQSGTEPYTAIRGRVINSIKDTTLSCKKDMVFSTKEEVVRNKEAFRIVEQKGI